METETYRYSRAVNGVNGVYTVARRSDGKILGTIKRIETSYPKARSASGHRTGYSRMAIAIAFDGFAPGSGTCVASSFKREEAARHLDAIDRARAAAYQKGDKIDCIVRSHADPEGHWGVGLEIERIDGEHLYIVGHPIPITGADVRVSSVPSGPLPVYTDDENALETETGTVPAVAAGQHHEEILAEKLELLRETAADRPAHAERLEVLIRHYSTTAGTQRPEDAPLCAGKDVSARVADLLDTDVSNLYWWRADPGTRQRQQLQYPAYREQQRTLTARRRTSAARNTLADMLDLSSPSEGE